MKNVRFLTIAAILVLLSSFVQAVGIKLNQIGFYAGEQKLAAVTILGATSFEIIEASNGKTVYTGQLTTAQTWSSSGEMVSIANFTDFTQTGNFKIKVGTNTSYEFKIERKDLFRDLSIYSIKGFYFWRASTAIESQYAQFKNRNYARAAGHPDNKVLVHSSAASTARPVGTVISSPKGWYDAGDYNKYVVNAGIPVFSLLTSYEQFPEYYKKLSLNIPESTNSLPDILDEVKWETDWLLTMQDPNDGGVYFKLTNLNFDGMSSMPNKATNARYVVGKTTTSALDFAAMMAMTARVFKEYETVFPGYAKQCEDAAKKAYDWAVANPNIEFKNPTDVKTGQYGDNSFSDEFTWARIELFITTNDVKYINAVSLIQSLSLPQWPNVGSLGFVSLMQNLDKVNLTDVQKANIKAGFNSLSNSILNTTKTSPYRIAMTQFSWGSNGDAAMQGLFLGSAWRFTKNKEYLNGAISALDYLMGRNAVDYSFVTGFGTQSPMNIHDRRSNADGIVEPIPGYVSGGPNASPANDCSPVPLVYSKAPAMRWSDTECSYSTNEIAVNWNGPLAYLAGAVESQLSDPSLMPLSLQISENGKEILLSYDQDITPTAALDGSFQLLANGVAVTIDTVLVRVESSKLIVIALSESIKPEYNELALSLTNTSLTATNGAPLTVFNDKKITNTVKGASPVVLSAKVLVSGKEILVKFSKKIAIVDSLMSGFSINKTNAVLGASINKKDSTEITLFTTEIQSADIVMLSYNGTSVKTTETALLLPFSPIGTNNQSSISPVQLLSAAIQADGFSVLIQASREVISASPLKGLVVSQDNTDLAIKSYQVSGKNVLLVFNDRFTPTTKLTLNYGKGSISAADGNVVDSIKNLAIVNALPKNPAYIVANYSSPVIEAEKFDYNNGMAVEGTGDQNLGYIATGEWVDYRILVQDTGLYYINASFASAKATGICQYQIWTPTGVEVLGSIAVPSTGDWTKWKTFSTPVHLKAGLQVFRIYAAGPDFNITKFEISRSSAVLTDVPALPTVDMQVLVYPQPATAGSEAVISINASIDQRQIIVTLVSLDGRIMMQQEFADKKQVTLPVSIAIPGCYFVQVRTNDETIVKTIVVK